MDTCGAKTRSGTPCKQRAIYENGRCKFHGGLATGPVTEAGKEQCRINGRKGGRPSKVLAVEKTEVLKPVKTSLLPVLPNDEMSNDVYILSMPEQPKIIPEKPKSWMLKEVKVLPRCECCTMFASNGACLAVAKGVIPSMPTGESCTAFSAF